MPHHETIYILLASCNAGPYLQPQLASLLAQSDPDWRLLVRDDGSTDGTRERLEDFARQERRACLLADDAGRLGIRGNFAALLHAAREQRAPLFALCDQDDIWHPERLATLRRLAAGTAPDTPLLTYSDLRLVDEAGQQLAPSHFARAGAMAALEGAAPWLIAHNLVPGCCMGGNRALLELALPFPGGVTHHDWWLLLVAAAAGEVRTTPAALVDYRQHARNAIGAHSPADQALRFLGAFPRRLAQARRQLQEALSQVDALLTLPATRLHPDWRAAAQAYRHGLGSPHLPTRLGTALRGPVQRLGLPRQALHLLLSLYPPLNTSGSDGSATS